MKSTYFEQALALAGSLIVIIGVSAAANSAFADETRPSVTEATVAEASQAISDSANQATTRAIDAAISSVGLANELDLDIRLLDRISLTAQEL